MTSSILNQIFVRTQTANDFDIFDQKYQEKETEFDIDPLILSCSAKDLYQKHGDSRYFSLNDVEVKQNVNPKIVEHAEQVRKYYTKKYFWNNFTDRLSSYRTRVCYLLEHRVSKIKEQDAGIYFKLPWFYDEDMVYDEFKKNLKTDDIPRLGGNDRSKLFLKRLEFLNTSFAWQRKRKITRYWFKDDNNYLYGIELETGNPLLPMFEQHLKDNPIPLLQARLTEDRIDRMHYYKLYSYTFLKEKNA